MDTSESTTPPNITISPSEIDFLKSLLDAEVQRHRALVELSILNIPNQTATQNNPPLIENLSEYPHNLNLENLVTYPPKLEPIPVKPLFFDAAWNYIEYPGREIPEVAEKPAGGAQETGKAATEQAAPQKKGWFGFGR